MGLAIEGACSWIMAPKTPSALAHFKLHHMVVLRTEGPRC